MGKLPLYRLHIWLPKVHVEASIVRLLVLMSAVVIINVIDGKGFAAYSSVLHMSLCVIFGLVLMLLVGYIHIVLSPLMFITVYIGYVISGSRFYLKIGLIMMVL